MRRDRSVRQATPQSGSVTSPRCQFANHAVTSAGGMPPVSRNGPESSRRYIFPPGQRSRNVAKLSTAPNPPADAPETTILPTVRNVGPRRRRKASTFEWPTWWYVLTVWPLW